MEKYNSSQIFSIFTASEKLSDGLRQNTAAGVLNGLQS